MKITDSELATAKCTILYLWKTHLKSVGVRHPRKYLTPLAILYMHGFNNPMSQQQLADACYEVGVSYDRQIRHLARFGWYVVTGRDHKKRKWITRDCRIGGNDVYLKCADKVNPKMKKI